MLRASHGVGAFPALATPLLLDRANPDRSSQIIHNLVYKVNRENLDFSRRDGYYTDDADRVSIQDVVNSAKGGEGMSTITAEGNAVAKTKKSGKGRLIRVSDKFADAIMEAASFEKLSIAEFSDKHLLSIVEKRYKDAIMREAKKFTRKEEGESDS
jgi:hypothetical protein